MHRLRNEYIREAAYVKCFGDKVREDRQIVRTCSEERQ